MYTDVTVKINAAKNKVSSFSKTCTRVLFVHSSLLVIWKAKIPCACMSVMSLTHDAQECTVYVISRIVSVCAQCHIEIRLFTITGGHTCQVFRICSDYSRVVSALIISLASPLVAVEAHPQT